MMWSQWKKIFGRPAEISEQAPGCIVWFSRGGCPDNGQIAGEGNDLRVPIHRLRSDGALHSRRQYWRNRSQVYVKAHGGLL